MIRMFIKFQGNLFKMILDTNAVKTKNNDVEQSCAVPSFSVVFFSL